MGSHPYRAKEGSENSLDEEREQLEGEARIVFERWARQLPMARDASAALRQISPRVALVGRLRTVLEASPGGARTSRLRESAVRLVSDAKIGFSWATWDRDYPDDDIGLDGVAVCTVNASRKLEPADLSEVPQAWREAYWKRLQIDPLRGERVVSQSFTLWRVPMVDVTYAIGAARQTVTFEGARMLPPPHSADRLFHARAAKVRRWIAGLCLALLAALLLSTWPGSASPGGAPRDDSRRESWHELQARRALEKVLRAEARALDPAF